MNILNLIIDDKKYEYIDCLKLDNDNYVAFFDDNNIFIKKYMLNKSKIEFLDIDDNTYDKVKKEMGI